VPDGSGAADLPELARELERASSGKDHWTQSVLDGAKIRSIAGYQL
jgi:hypothetical protein